MNNTQNIVKHFNSVNNLKIIAAFSVYKTILRPSTFLLLLIITISNSSDLSSKEDYTQFSLKAGGSLNTNMYFSDFRELPGYPTCCNSFNFTYGPGYSIFAGGEYLLSEKFYGIEASLDVLLSFKDLSAEYLIEDEFANIISGNDYEKGIVNHRLNANIKSYSLDIGVNSSPFSDLPLRFRLGLQFGLLNDMTFDQDEKIVSPDWITYKETGTKTKYSYNAEIPDHAGLYSAISLGVKYSSIKLGKINLSPRLTFNYGFSNIVNDLDWKISSLELGLVLAYRIPKPENIPPMQAPLPDLPEPPKSQKLIAEINVSKGNREFDNNDTLNINVIERKFVDRYILLPVIFYQINTSEMLMPPDAKLRSEERAQKYAYRSVLQYLEKNPDVNVKLISNSLDTESTDSVNKRINDIKLFLKTNGIPEDRFFIDNNVVDASKLEREELLEDNCFIRFNFSNGTKILRFKGETKISRILQPEEISIEPKIFSETGIEDFNGKIEVNDSTIYQLATDKNIVEINEDFLMLNSDTFDENPQNLINDQTKDFTTKQIEIILNIRDVMKQEIKEIFTLFVNPHIKNAGVYENIISDIEQSDYVRQLLLAYCTFDKADLYAVNDEAVKEIKEAFNKGQLIEIIPLYDFLGSDEHNQRLAKERAKSALKLLGLNYDDVKITILSDYFFSNDNPYSRMMNRAVIVRIKDIIDHK